MASTINCGGLHLPVSAVVEAPRDCQQRHRIRAGGTVGELSCSGKRKRPPSASGRVRQIDTISANITAYSDATITAGTHFWREAQASNATEDFGASNACDVVERSSSNIGTVAGGIASARKVGSLRNSLFIHLTASIIVRASKWGRS